VTAHTAEVSLAPALAATGVLCVCDSAWIAARSQILVSRHLRALRGRSLFGAVQRAEAHV
jgi:hypothetical protein